MIWANLETTHGLPQKNTDYTPDQGVTLIEVSLAALDQGPQPHIPTSLSILIEDLA